MLESAGKSFDGSTGESRFAPTGRVVYRSGMRIEEQPLPDGEYLYQFEVYDIFGRAYYSETAFLSCEGDQIYIY